MHFFTQSSGILPTANASTDTGLKRPQDDIDDFLSSDLDLSFTSDASLNSPPLEDVDLIEEDEHFDFMEISPAPPPRIQYKSNDQHTAQRNRPRAHTSAARLFGNDLSNSPPSRTVQRANIPPEWTSGAQFTEPVVKTLFATPPNQQSSPSPDMDDFMDVDSSFSAVETLLIPSPSPSEPSGSPQLPPSPLPLSAALTVTQFDSLFYEPGSPANLLKESSPCPNLQKRRSLSSKTGHHAMLERSPSPALDSSPSVQKLQRIASGSLLTRLAKPAFEGLGTPPNALKRTHRPALSAVIPSSNGSKSKSNHSVPTSGESQGLVVPRSRRAFSALLPGNPFDEESRLSSPVPTHLRRQHGKTIGRCDVNDEIRLPVSAIEIDARETPPHLKDSPSARYLSAGLPGFGDNEAHGKILPCRKVAEDGLMRINCQTLDDLLDGHYKPRIRIFHVLDCRFDYEYNGGHIPGAINVNTIAAVEEFFFGVGISRPQPCTSGDSVLKTVIIFHCEFSAKRAPTFAKHLRAKDRALNNHVYPKIHYPEIYILEGGYCQYFSESAARCEPRGYVTMDDPRHAASRREDLDQFRKTRFGRVKSYAYGDGNRPGMMFARDREQVHMKRNTASIGSGSMFAADHVARMTRTAGEGLKTLAEDGNTTQDEEEGGVEDSPCPPASFPRGMKAYRPLARAETLGPTKLMWK